MTITLHNGDCLDVMRSLPDASVDLVVTSPPYNLRNTTGGGMGYIGGIMDHPLNNGYDSHDDNMPHADYVQWQRDCLTEMMRLIPDAGAIFYNHKWRVQDGLLQDRHDITDGFPVRQIIIWNRRGGHNFNSSFFLPTYEVIYLIAKKSFKLVATMNRAGDIWEFGPEIGSNHPAPFPLQLPLRCIQSTNAKTVLDPFSGSGTTGLACRCLDRDYIGIEKSPLCHEMAQKRLSQEVVQKALL